MTWTAHRVAPGVVHVIPDDDATTHTTDGCVCGPSPESILEDGQYAVVFTHAALDGRG